MSLLPTIFGLCLALGGPLLLASCSDRYFGDSERLPIQIIQQLILIAFCVAILGIVIFWEQQPIGSIGLHSLCWRSILWGVAVAGILIFIYSPLLMWVMDKLGLAGFDSGLAKLSSLPVWYLILAVTIGGVVEEVLYRGYATERLSLLSGSYWMGSIFALLAFGLAHVPMWGWGAASTTVVSGGLLTLLYLGTGDLSSSIAAHIVTDSVGIIILPNITHTRCPCKMSNLVRIFWIGSDVFSNY